MHTEDLMFRPDLMKGQRVLISGGGSGLGRVMADAVAALGADLYICGRRGEVLEEAADQLRSQHGARVVPLDCDIRSDEAIEALLDQIWDDGGPLTGLVNNAAGNFLSRTEDLSPRGFDAIANIVFRGTFLLTAACGRRWISGGDRGSVLSVLASWIDGGVPFTVPSAMSKAGVDMMTRSLALEWGPRGIRLNSIAPGVFPTAGVQAHLRPGQEPDRPGGPNALNPLKRNGRMSELANLAVFLLGPGAEYINGQTILIDGGDSLQPAMLDVDRHAWTDEDWRRAREVVTGHDRDDRARHTA
ncbi:SDR family oxidoreductase [Rhodococcus koreensis]